MRLNVDGFRGELIHYTFEANGRFLNLIYPLGEAELAMLKATAEYKKEGIEEKEVKLVNIKVSMKLTS